MSNFFIETCKKEGSKELSLIFDAISILLYIRKLYEASKVAT